MTGSTDPTYASVLVTGASRGIGAAICLRLAARGMTVYGVARDAQALDALKLKDGRVVPVVADVRNVDAIDDALMGRQIDVLVNNAGIITSVGSLQEQDEQEVREMVEVNLIAPLLLARRFLPGMVARRRGHVFNVTSTSGHYVFPGAAVYGATKAGLSHAGRVMRHDLAGTQVRLTEVSLGRVETDIYLKQFGGNRDKLQEAFYRSVRAIRPDEVAAVLEAALFMPPHVDVSFLEVVPTDQAPGGQTYPADAS